MACRECGAEAVSRTCVDCANIKLGYEDEANRVYGSNCNYNILLLRFFAYLIDSILYSMIVFVCVAIFILSMPIVMPGKSFNVNDIDNINFLSGAIIAMYCICLLSICFLIGLSYLFYAGTPGKAILGIKVINTKDGSDCYKFFKGISREIIGKNISGAIAFVGFIVAFFDEERAALHDYIFHTRVVASFNNSDSAEIETEIEAKITEAEVPSDDGSSTED